MKTNSSFENSTDSCLDLSPCGLCQNPVAQGEDALKCDRCSQWVCISCLDEKKGCCPKKLYDHLVQLEEDVDFPWDCPNCANMSLPEQLVNCDLLTKRILMSQFGVPSSCFEPAKNTQRVESQLPTEGGSTTPACEEPMVGSDRNKKESPGVEKQCGIVPATSSVSAVSDQGSMAHLMFKMMEMQQIKDEKDREDRQKDREDRQKDREFQQQILSALLKNQQSNVTENSTPVPDKPPPSMRRLPKKELLTFDGNISEWPAFWESFEVNVGSRTDLSASLKLDYLHQSLKGAAKNKIKGMSLEGANYEEAVTILKKEYARPTELRETHIRKLLHVFPVKETLSNLEDFIDTVRAASASLKQMGVSKTTIDAYVVSLYDKLPGNVQMKIKEKRLEKGDSLDSGNMEEFLKMLDFIKRVQVGSFIDKNRNELTVRKMPALPPTASFVSSSSSGRKARLPCAFCESTEHLTLDCKVVPDVEGRKRKAEKKGKCGRCLGLHMTSDCKNSMQCYCCGNKGHHSAFCFKKNGKTTVVSQKKAGPSADRPQDPEKDGKKADALQVHLAGPDEEDGIIMSTFYTTARTRNTENAKSVNVYLDTGAKCTCIDQAKAAELQLESKGQIVLEMARFNSDSLERIHAELVELELLGKDGFKIKINAYSIPNMTPALSIHPMRFSKSTWKKIREFQPENCPPRKKWSMKIDILIGMDYWYQIMGPVASRIINIQDNLFIHCSPMGNILAGNLQKQLPKEPQIHVMFSNMEKTGEPAFSDLSNLWKLEAIGVQEKRDEICTKEEELLQQFGETVQYERDRYHVTWPWKTANPELPTNFGIAKSRLQHTVNTLLRSSNGKENFEEYDRIIEDQLEKGIIEKVSSKKPDGPVVYYIPHFPHIKQDRATTKVRIVYDASAKTKPHGTSLNDLMYTGKNFLEDLCGILMRFRMNKIAITADIEKAFLQVGLQVPERDCTRFLWLKDKRDFSVENNLQVYRFTRVPFGVVSSPYLLGATIDYHLKQNPGSLANRIHGNIYMDNVFFGVESAEEGTKLYHDCKNLFYKASMNLREWGSNDQTFINSVPAIDQAKGDNVKVLGLQWNTTGDTIQVKTGKEPSTTEPQTKRKVLQTIAQVFDPMGLVNPLTIRGKMKIQDLWKEQLDWDSELPPHDLEDWNAIRNVLSDIPKVVLPRQMLMDPNRPFYLLCFCDASKSAYAAVVYLYQGGGFETSCKIVFSKSRVSPLKPQLTIPRLELLGVLIGVRALRFVEKQLDGVVLQKILWTDSMIVLGWLDSAKTSDLYVRRRVEEIKEKKDIDFCYISTKDNPADVATRGTSYESLIKSSWFNGPDWILQHRPPWDTVKHIPNNPTERKLSSTETYEAPMTEAVVETVAMKSKTQQIIDSPYRMQIDTYSSLQQVLEDTAHRQRQDAKLPQNIPLSAAEIKTARKKWIKSVQQECFKETFQCLSDGKLDQISRQLNLFIKDGLIRCGGRMANAKISKDAKFPFLLPQNHHFTELVIFDAHRRLLHSGPRATLSEIRTKYWIPRGLSQTQRILKKCVTCRKAEGESFQRPKMGMMPPERLSRSRAFQFVGMDYLGPLNIKTKGKSPYEKRWIAIFTCFTTRAVHLELVKDSSATSAISVLTRFVSRRGSPDILLSDNAPQFKCAADHLKRMWGKRINEESFRKLHHFFADREIKWQTIPEGTPWVGGFYERLIGLIKRTIRKVLWNTTVDEEHLCTLVTEIESILNRRPLLNLGTRLGDCEVLTPADFIAPTSRLGMPPADKDFSDPDYSPTEDSQASKTLQKEWKQGQRMLDRFWKIWQNQYLQQLRESHRNFFKRKPGEVRRKPTVGEVVLVRSGTPRVSWKLAVIEKLLSSQDGETRFAQIRFQNGTVTRRSIGDLIPLEMEQENAKQCEALLCSYSDRKENGLKETR